VQPLITELQQIPEIGRAIANLNYKAFNLLVRREPLFHRALYRLTNRSPE